QRQPQQQPTPTQQRQPQQQPIPAQQQRPARQFNFNAPPPPVPVQRPVQPYGPPRGQQPQVQATPSPTVVSPLAEDKNVTWLNAGQRISLQEIQNQPLRIAYFHNHSKIKVDMDSYVFMLGGNGKVSRDEDMIFFGNEISADRSVKVSKDDDMPIVLIDLNKVSPSVEKIAITYSIYGDESRMNFSLIDEPIMRIFSGVKEVYRFRLKDLNLEKTVVATEIYRYKGAWKFNCVGGGYNDGLKKLCESYGVHIE
ncbi:MAG: TerD family protein, partial [Acutalibacteraceae bacterium]